MLTIERSTAFRRDYKREKRGQHRAALQKELVNVLKKLINDEPLDKKYRDHNLTNNWVGYRECHIKPDLLLIYEKPDAETLRLVRLGSHSQLFNS